MRIIDTHTHIFSAEFDGDINDVIQRAKQIGVERILLPNIDVESISRVNQMAADYEGYCLPMMGLHPTSVTQNWQNDLSVIKQQFLQNDYIAVGEIGMDLYWDKSLEKEQRLAFEEQLRWSIEYDLPVSIHSRNANVEVIECIKNVDAKNLRGVFHSFGGTMEELTAILDLDNFYLGINGVVTYKNSTLPEVLKQADLSRIVVETDAPYLPPVPYRGKRNEPSYTIKVVEKLSEVFNVPSETVGEITTQNAKDIFRI